MSYLEEASWSSVEAEPLHYPYRHFKSNHFKNCVRSDWTVLKLLQIEDFAQEICLDVLQRVITHYNSRKPSEPRI